MRDQEPCSVKSYTSMRWGIAQRLVDVHSGLRQAFEDPAPRVGVMVQRLQATENRIASALGSEVAGKQILEIGPGQLFPQMLYFSRKNDVIGIDLDVLAQGADAWAYLRMLRCNGPLRVAKTLARKALGYDGRYQRELARQLEMGKVPSLKCIQMDATDMRFDEAQFDVVMSYSVFEHLPDPGRVLKEIRRVLRPGGVAFTSIHLYTCDNGCHDPRLFGPNRSGIPRWAHLRPQQAHRVRPNAFLNQLRLSQWKVLFDEWMPDCTFEHHAYTTEEERRDLKELRARGELQGYDDVELLTVDFDALWRKPAR